MVFSKSAGVHLKSSTQFLSFPFFLTLPLLLPTIFVFSKFLDDAFVYIFKFFPLCNKNYGVMLLSKTFMIKFVDDKMNVWGAYSFLKRHLK